MHLLHHLGPLWLLSLLAVDVLPLALPQLSDLVRQQLVHDVAAQEFAELLTQPMPPPSHHHARTTAGASASASACCDACGAARWMAPQQRRVHGRLKNRLSAQRRRARLPVDGALWRTCLSGAAESAQEEEQ